ncbi:Attractin [Symbiodinium microadriaticum]|uniref:Attractin n=1 Tax=Symbiodinium microadriaticum TaxID=2951 RepID=A0A1Q9E9E5_SYMMI|nr:Attractin [Symbiodinium microadriaticum]
MSHPEIHLSQLQQRRRPADVRLQVALFAAALYLTYNMPVWHDSPSRSPRRRRSPSRERRRSRSFVVTSGVCKAYSLFPSQVPDEYDRGRFHDPTFWDGAYDYNYDYSNYGYGYFSYTYSAYTGAGEGPINCPAKSGSICCVRAPGYPYRYDQQGCVIEVISGNAMFLQVMDFETQAAVLIVNGQNYSGYTGPSGVVPQGSIIFSPEIDRNEDSLRGFAVCLVPDAPEAPPPSPEVPNAGWRVLSGRCAMDADGCISSPNFQEGLKYDLHGCSIEVDANNSKYMNISSFATRTGEGAALIDVLQINGQSYSGFLESAELLAPPQGIIRWIPGPREGRFDYKYKSGWRVCLTDGMAVESSWHRLGASEETRHAHSAVWDPVDQAMLVFGGKVNGVYNHASRFVKYALQANAWTSLEPTWMTTATTRMFHTAVWDPVRRQMLIFGGKSFNDDNNRITDFTSKLHVYDLEDNTVTDPMPAIAGGLPESELGRYDHTAVWDPQLRTMWVFGGRHGTGLCSSLATECGVATADLFSYEMEANLWTKVDGDGALPPPAHRHLAVWAPTERSMYILSDAGPSVDCELHPGCSYQTLLRYDTQGNRWSKLIAPEMQPTMYFAGHRAVAAWDPAAGTMLVTAEDIWEIDLQANTTAVFGGAGKMGYQREDFTSVFVPAARQLLVFGGERAIEDGGTRALSDIISFRKEICRPDIDNGCQCLPGFELRENSSCEPCDAGRFKDSAGFARCESCPIASTSLGRGNAECISCQPGFTNTAEDTGCVEVLAEVQSLWFCPVRQVCVVRALPGLSHYGHHYRMQLTKSKCNETDRDDTGIGILNAGMSGFGEDNGTVFVWGESGADFQPVPDLLNVCLCVSRYCEHEWNYVLSVGQMFVAGPLWDPTDPDPPPPADCVMGRDCFDVAFAGAGLTLNGSEVRVQRSACDSITVTEKAQQATLKRVELVAADMTSVLTMDFKFIQLEYDPIPYYICWCGSSVEGNCEDPYAWIQAGEMRIVGPFNPHEAHCAVGQVCTFPLITGYGLRGGDRIMVLEVCGGGSPLPGFPGDGMLETPGNGTDDGQEFLFIGASQEVRGRPGVYRLCFCRPVPDVDNCTLAEHFTQAIGFLVLAGPLEKVTTCELGADCTVDFVGSNLAAGDEVTVVAGNDCSAGPTSMGALGYPTLTSTMFLTKTGARYQALLGLPQLEGTPGIYRMCWCSEASDCSSPDAFVSAGQLELTCPPGRYSMGLSSGRKCRLCTRGHFCAGGSTDFAVRIGCPARHTTKTLGAVTQVACECERGYELGDDIQSCVSCGIGFYKDEISDASCKSCPEGLTTYMQGSVSNASCIDRAELLADSRNVTIQASNHSTVPAVVVRLELMDLPEAQTSMTSGLLDELQAMLRAAISNVVGGQQTLTLEILPAAERRLATYNMQLELKVKHRTVQEAQVMLQELDVDAISAGIAESTADNPMYSSMSTRLSVPTLSEATILCPIYRSVPPGVQVLSSSGCQCSPGYGFVASGDICELCAEGEYKATVGNVLCTKCPQWMSTAVLLTVPTRPLLPAGAMFPCPNNTLTATADVGGSSEADCICSAGYFREQVSGCIPCRRGYYKPNDGDQDCRNSCPTNGISNEGAVDVGDCFCIDGYHAIMGLRNGTQEELESCAPCKYKGLTCQGGLDSAGAHRQPIAEVGFFQTGETLAAKCQVFFLGGESVCLGGNECAEGSTGFLCGSCPPGFSRNQYPDACSECRSSFSWMGLVVFTDIAQNILINFAVASLAAMAAVKDSRSVHTSMIRIGTQFMTACSVLGHYDIDQLQVFEWSLEAKIKECSQNDDPCDDLTSLNFEWPNQVSAWLRFVSGVLDIASKLSAVSFTLSCWAEHISDSPVVKQLMPGLYFVVLPLMAILSSYVLCAVVAYIVVPLLRKVGIEVTEAAKKRKKRRAALEVLGDVLTPELKDLNLTFQDVKDSSALDDLGLPEIYMGIDDPQSLMEGVQPRLLPARLKKGADRVKEDPRVVALLEVADLDFSACVENPGLLSDLDSSLGGQLDPFGELDLNLMDLLVRRALAFALVKASFTDPLPLDKLAVAVSQKYSSVGEMKKASEGDEFMLVAEEVASVLRMEPSNFIAAEVESGDTEEDMDTLDFGLFTRKPSPMKLLYQSVPVIWVTLINMWPGLLSQYLQMIWCQPVQEETGVVQRLLPHPDLQCWSSDHMPLAVIAIIGLGCWCVGMPLLLILVIYRLKDKNSPENQRRFGYFINGFEPRFWWYDLVVRRLDIAFMMLVTYTSLTDDQRAKLLSYPVISGAQMAICAWLQPFENSQAQILDFFEIGLAIFRFLLFSMVSVILILAPRREATWILAGSLATLFTVMCCYLGLHILAQFLRDTSHQLDEAEEDEKKMHKSGKRGAGNILSGLASKVKTFAVKTAAPFFQEPSDEQYMLQWGFHSSSIAFESEASAAARKSKASILGSVRRRLLRFGRFYQYRSTGKALDDFAGLWLGVFRQSALPKDAMEVLCILTSAHKSVPFKTPKSDIPSLWKSRIQALLAAKGAATFRFTPDEMITAIQRLGSLRAADAVELVQATSLPKSPPPESSAGNLQLVDLPDLREDEHGISI